MRRLLILLATAILLTGCAAMIVIPHDVQQQTAGQQRTQAGQTGSIVQGQPFPCVTTVSGIPVTVLPPTGNLAVVVNPDGTHSTAIINGSDITIVTP